jgi:hypothetical protein
VTQEETRLQETGKGKSQWRKWGSYLSERQWGTPVLHSVFNPDLYDCGLTKASGVDRCLSICRTFRDSPP